MSETNTPPGGIGRALVAALDKSIGIHQPAVAAHVRRIRERRPEASPSDVIALLEKQYLAAVISTGAATGGVAAAPGVGTAAAVALSVGETASFLEVSALFSLAVAEVHGLRIDDLERRRTLLLTVLLGDSGASLVEKAAGRTGKHWGRLLTEAIPMSTITKVNKVLGRWFITKYGTKQGIIVLGRLAPFGIGAGIGGAGNALFGRTVVAGARRAFGPPDGRWHDEERFPASPSAEDPADDDASTCPPETSTGSGQDGRGATTPTAPTSLADELAKLAALHSSGALSLAEFEQAKKRVLDGAT